MNVEILKTSKETFSTSFNIKNANYNIYFQKHAYIIHFDDQQPRFIFLSTAGHSKCYLVHVFGIILSNIFDTNVQTT